MLKHKGAKMHLLYSQLIKLQTVLVLFYRFGLWNDFMILIEESSPEPTKHPHDSHFVFIVSITRLASAPDQYRFK